MFVPDDVIEKSESYIGRCKLLLFVDYDHLGVLAQGWKMTMFVREATYIANIDEHV